MVVIFLRDCVPEEVVPLYAVDFIYILVKQGLVFYYCAVLCCVQIMEYIMAKNFFMSRHHDSSITLELKHHTVMRPLPICSNKDKD